MEALCEESEEREEWRDGWSMFKLKVERVGDFTNEEEMLPFGPWPREKVERVGEGIAGAECE